MENTFTGAVESITGREVNTKYGTKTVFDVVIGGRKLSTFKSEVAEEANALKGSTVEATYREEQKGDFTNLMLLGVTLVDAGGTTALSTSSSTIPVATATTEKKGWQPEDTARVTKLSCLSTAFQYCSAMGNSEDDAIVLAQRLYGIAMGERGVPEEPVVVGAAVSASEQTDDVPW